MHRFRVGDALVTKIPELNLDGVAPAFLYPDADPGAVVDAAARCSAGSYDVATSSLRQSTHSWLVELDGRVILVDTASGNDKDRPTIPVLDHLAVPYLERLASAGVAPEAVDIVLMTHVHADHVGWNTRLREGQWVPTFPKATYYFSAVEASYGAALEAGDEAAAGALRDAAALGPMARLPAPGVYADSIAPIEAAGLARRIEIDGREVVPGFSYLAMPGHSIDHGAIVLRCGSALALFWGDVLHHPVQVANPAWNSAYCEFPQAAARSRREALTLAADTGAIVFTTHFAESSAGHVRRQRDGSLAWTFATGEDA
jgi:glyoxylase-like metal-dependent hydrolase (beta-lactamase superfamily II)